MEIAANLAKHSLFPLCLPLSVYSATNLPPFCPNVPTNLSLLLVHLDVVLRVFIQFSQMRGQYVNSMSPVILNGGW
jgi:hypothetical protein